MSTRSVFLWLGVGMFVASAYLVAAYAGLQRRLSEFADVSQRQVFVAGSCPYSQPVVAFPPEGTVVIPVDWDDEVMTMGLCERFMDADAFSAVPLRLRCSWLVDWAERQTRDAVGFPAYREGTGDFEL